MQILIHSPALNLQISAFDHISVRKKMRDPLVRQFMRLLLLSLMLSGTAKAQMSLCKNAGSSEPLLLAHTK